ncbi:PREDICTED: uncharacterized protein LOC106745563 [Dinoponera quadriceps]|uniref:Uncharacterized protein LOC106745563 n=1 Tax=Dinoponera quadriceps TaxID=609295 RepID=A0A6P3XEF4_DINQU|nr:PREDICTED: uncharacterized protein LOC106745563 [Dinoponera quadriceps]
MEISHDGRTTSLNASYQRDIRFIFTPSNWTLGSIGIWPIAFRGIGQHISKISIFTCNFVLSFAIVPCALHMIYDQKDINIRLKLTGLLGFCSTAMIKFFVLVIRRPKIQKCIEHVKDDWWQVKFKSDRERMLKYASIGRNLSLTCTTAMYSAGFIYHLILPFCTEHKIGNETIRPLVYPTYSGFRQSQISPIYEIVYVAHCMCGYTIYTVTIGTCGLAAIFAMHACGQIQVVLSRLEDLLNGKNFERIPNVQQRIAAIVKSHIQVMSALRPTYDLRPEGHQYKAQAHRTLGLLQHCYDKVLRSCDTSSKNTEVYRVCEGRLVADTITIGTCGLAAIFAMHACGQIQVVLSRLEDLLNGKNFEQFPNVQLRIAAIVKSHVQVMRFAANVDEILQEVCLVDFTSSVCIICLLEYYCILDWQANDRLGLLTYFMSFVSFVFNAFILCYIGELLIEKSSQVGIMCCLINWYQLPPRSARDFILIIAMSSHPIKISACKMVDISLSTFGYMIKTTLAYLSFLRTLVM